MQQKALSSTRLIRSYNVATILQTLFRHGGCTRTDLAGLTNMSMPTVSRITTELVAKGVITEAQRTESHGGRPPVILRLCYNRLFVIGIQLERDKNVIAIADLKGKVLHRRAFRPYALDPVFFVRELGREVEQLVAASGIGRAHILGVGVAVSGVVHKKDAGTTVRSVSLGWQEVRIAGHLEQALELPVFIENDANAGALAELWFGCTQHVSNSLYLKTEAGIGAGIIIDRQLVNGPRGMAGEIGHVPLMQNGLLCRCGQTGCLAPYVNVTDVVQRYARLTGRHVDSEGFFQFARDGDPAANVIIEQAAQALAVVLSYANSLLDLDVVVVGGQWGAFSERFLDAVQVEIQKAIDRTGLSKSVEVTGSSLGEDSDLLGAVGLVVNHWFSPVTKLGLVESR